MINACIPSEYKFNLSIKPSEQIYAGTVYLTYQEIPTDKHIILNCDENIQINYVKYKGQELQYMHNKLLRTLHIACIFPEDLQNRILIAISFTGILSMDEKQGFFYIDDSTCALHLFPNFSFLFIPTDIMNDYFDFNVYNISGNIVVENENQIVVSSVPFSQVSKFLGHQKMFKFGNEFKFPLPYFAMVIGEYTLYIDKKITNNHTKLDFFFDTNIQTDIIESLFSFLKKSIFAIEKLFDLNNVLGCIQIVDVPDFPENESNAFGLIIFTPSTLNSFMQNKHFIIKQILKQFLYIFPTNAKDCWIIEGLTSYLALVILPLIDQLNEFPLDSKMEIEIEQYMFQFFRKALNSDNDPHGRSLKDSLTSLDDGILFDSINIYKSTCLFKMLLYNKTFNFMRNALSKLTENISLTYEKFIDSFECEQYLISYINNPGYPILILDDDFTLHQTRFTLTKAPDFLWTIPITISILTLNSPQPNLTTDDSKTSKNCDSLINEISTITFLFDKKDINLRSLLLEKGVESINENTFIIINPFCESLCRVWYKGQWINKLSQYAEIISSTKYRNALFNVFMDMTALQDMGLVDKKLLANFRMFEIPPNIRKRFPLVRGNGSILCSYAI